MECLYLQPDSDSYRNYWINAGVVELVDTLDLGSSAARCGSSSLPTCTKAEEKSSAFFVLNSLEKRCR